MSEEYRIEDSDVIEIDLISLCKELIRKWYVVAIVAVIAAVLMAAYTLISAGTKYVSTGSAYLLSKTDRSTAITSGELTASATLAGDFVQVLQGNDVMQATIEKLNLSMTPAALKSAVTVSNTSDTRVVTIKVSDKKAAQAQKIADTILEVADEKAASISSTLHVEIIDKPNLPRSATRPSIKSALVKGFIIGFMIACLYTVIAWLIKRPIWDERDAANYFKAPVLGSLPMGKA